MKNSCLKIPYIFEFAITKSGQPTIQLTDTADQSQQIQASAISDNQLFWLGSGKPILLDLNWLAQLADTLYRVVNHGQIVDPDEQINGDNFELEDLASEVWSDLEG